MHHEHFQEHQPHSQQFVGCVEDKQPKEKYLADYLNKMTMKKTWQLIE